VKSLSCTSNNHVFKGCDPNFEVTIFQILKVAANGTSTLH